MNDNLQEMIGEDFNVDNEELLDLDKNYEEESLGQTLIVPEDKPIIETPVGSLPLIPLSTWFKNNYDYLSVKKSIGYLNLKIKGYDPNECLLFAVPHPEGGVDEKGHDRIKLRFFDNSSKVFIPELKENTEDFRALNSGFIVIQKYNDDIVLKNYIFKTGLLMTFCCRIDNMDIPYNVIKLNKKDKSVEIPECNRLDIINKLDTKVDKQSLQLLYKQVEKYIDEITTLKDAIIWLGEKQKEVNDLYHLSQIDNAIIEIIR